MKNDSKTRKTDGAPRELAGDQVEQVAGGFQRNNLGLFTLDIGTVENL